MSFRTVQQRTVEKSESLSVPVAAAARGAGAGWIRNPAWPALPSISASEDKVVGLYAVYPGGSNFAAVNFTTSTGTYTVDWGDGTTPVAYTSATQANYNYNYAAAGLTGTDGPVTFTAADSRVNRTAHGFPAGYAVSFDSIVTTTGISAGQIYYVINPTSDSFQLSATVGGSAITLTGDGSGTLLPYKIATITITPTTAGNTFSTLNLAARNSSTSSAYSTGWLDLAIASSATNFSLGGNVVFHSNLEQIRILRHRATSISLQNCYKLANVVEITADTGFALTSCNDMFNNCAALTSVPLFNTASVTSMFGMFFSCTSLVSVPLFNTASVNSMNSMFWSCRSLTSVPLFNTAAVTTMTNTFRDCPSLTTVPLFNTASVNNMSSLFNACTSLTTVPLFNTAAVTNMTTMFNGCASLVSVPLFNTAAVTIMANMFSNCASLVSVPLFNTAAVTDMGAMFSNCTSLTTVPLFNTAAVQLMNSMFSGCSALTAVPPFNTAACTNMGSMFASCTSLPQIPAFDCSKIVLVGNNGFGTGLNSCRKNLAINTYYTWTVASQLLSGSALDEIYTNLGTVPAQGTAVTFQDTGDTVTLASHGYAAGRTIRFTTIVTTTGIAINTNYYVRNPTTDTFQLSTTPTGAIINLVNNGTGTVTGQVITVTGNWGTATDTPSIATAKGWTVTGS